jgi:hypothetical protein
VRHKYRYEQRITTLDEVGGSSIRVWFDAFNRYATLQGMVQE